MKHLLVIIATLLLMVSAAESQGVIERAAQRNQNPANAPGGIVAAKSGGPLSILAKPFQDLATLIAKSNADAITLSTAIPTLQDTNGQACWNTGQAFAQVIEKHPIPLTLEATDDIEGLRLLNMAANQVCASAACQIVFSDLANQATAVAALATPIGGQLINIPSLSTICAKIPQISPMLPGSATVPPTAAPAK